MKSLQEYITEDKKIIFENTEQFFEEYIRDNSNFTEHFKKRIKQGKLPDGSIPASKEEVENVIRKVDYLIEQWMLNNNPTKKKNILVGVRYYTKDGTSINFPGEVINFDFNTCRYRFAFITSHKYLHYKKFKFDKNDDLVIEYKDGKAKIVKF